MLFSGIDLHKRTLAIHTLDDEGMLVREATVSTPVENGPRRGFRKDRELFSQVWRSL